MAINNVTMIEKIKEVLEQTFAYNVENDKVAQEICDLFNFSKSVTCGNCDEECEPVSLGSMCNKCYVDF